MPSSKDGDDRGDGDERSPASADGHFAVTTYYFAARYSRHPEMRQYRTELCAAVPGSVVTSRWIDCHGGKYPRSFGPDDLSADPEYCWSVGQHDLEDLANADAIISFTDAAGGKGGRHVEHGVAISYVDNHTWLVLGGRSREPFRLIVIGPRENVFHCHPATEVYATFGDFLVAERARRELLEP